MALAREDRIDQVEPHILLSCFRSLQSIQERAMFSKKLPQLRERRNIWLAGDGDIGKSSIPSVFFRTDDFLFKTTNKWWGNFRGERVVLLQAE